MLNTPSVSPSIKPRVRIVLTLLLVIALLFSGCAGTSGSSEAESTPTPEPIPTATPEPIAAGRFMYHDYSTGIKPTDPNKIDCGAKLLALTFDDGPNGDTVEFVKALNELGVTCTFFMQGYMIGNYPEAVTAMVQGGHQIGNHTYNHQNLAKLSDSEAYDQIMDTEKLLKEIDGKDGHYIRCPYGNSTEYVSSMAPSPLIYWSVDTEDWVTLDADAVCSSIVNNAYDGAIILCHDIYGTTRQGALRAIQELMEEGYEFVTVEELFKRRDVAVDNGQTYFDAQNKGVNLPAQNVSLDFGTFSEDKKPSATPSPAPTPEPENEDDPEASAAL